MLHITIETGETVNKEEKLLTRGTLEQHQRKTTKPQKNTVAKTAYLYPTDRGGRAGGQSSKRAPFLRIPLATNRAVHKVRQIHRVLQPNDKK